MSCQVKEPILVIGIGGVGSKLAAEAKEHLNSSCLTISNDTKDLTSSMPSIHVSTDSIINPSVHLIRGHTYKISDEIMAKVKDFPTVVLISNLAGKTGAAMAPTISEICREAGVKLVSFAIMPFKYEKNRIFNSGISLKRLRENSQCTVVLDNDALLESNPDLNSKSCYEIANSALMHVVKSMRDSEMPADSNMITTSKNGQHIEDSLRDSLKMLYENAPPSAIKRSILHIVGGDNVPVGLINSVSSITRGIINKTDSQVDIASSSQESRVVMLSSVNEMKKFDRYDPLGMIPRENSVDWKIPDCSIEYDSDIYQLE